MPVFEKKICARADLAARVAELPKPVDASVKRLGKGDDRPHNTLHDRMAVLAALESVSLVVEFDEPTALEVVQEARPEIYAKGGDYVMSAIPEGQAVLAYGGRAVAIDFEHDRSTTKLVAKIRG